MMDAALQQLLRKRVAETEELLELRSVCVGLAEWCGFALGRWNYQVFCVGLVSHAVCF